MSRSIRRRHFLLSTGLGLAAVPALSSMRAHGQADTPKRLIVLSYPNGITDDWWPVGGESGWDVVDRPEAPLHSLLPHRERITVMGGIDLQNGKDSVREWRRSLGEEEGDLGGHAAPPFLFTGARGTPGPRIHDGVEVSSGHSSLDQYFAERDMGARERPYRSLVMRPLRVGRPESSFISYSGPCLDGATPNAPAPYDDPLALYDELFASGLTDAARERRRRRRASVLDLGRSELGRMRTAVGAADRARLDQHLEAIRAVERRLDTVTSCAAPARLPEGPDYLRNFGNENVPATIASMMDMMVLAMACDVTRVGSLMLSTSHNNEYTFPWLADREPGFAESIDFEAGEDTAGGGSDGFRHHHSIAHADGRGERQRLRKNYVDQWFAEQLAYLLDRLTETMDASGTPLIDNTIVVFANLQRTGGGHQTHDLPWIVAGNAAGQLRQGRYLRSLVEGADLNPRFLRPEHRVTTNQVLVTILNALGLEDEFFGTPDYGGALSILRS